MPYKRLVEIGEGTHTMMLEKNRMQFFREIIGFLDEQEPLALRSRARAVMPAQQQRHIAVERS